MHIALLHSKTEEVWKIVHEQAAKVNKLNATMVTLAKA
jgi:hypothetical protein